MDVIFFKLKIKMNWTKCPSFQGLILFDKSTILNLRENFASKAILLLSKVWFFVKQKLPILQEACVKISRYHVKWHFILGVLYVFYILWKYRAALSKIIKELETTTPTWHRRVLGHCTFKKHLEFWRENSWINSGIFMPNFKMFSSASVL